MSGKRLSYAVITPARNEADNLRRLAASLVDQTLEPAAWIVVDNGSSDESQDVVAALSDQCDWISLVNVPGADRARPGAPIVRAFEAGVAALDTVPDVVVKLDADVSFDVDYFERLARAFSDDPTLGIAGGICYELENGVWTATRVTGDHVRGASRAYRRACLEQVSPLEQRVGWDGIDELRASVLGWRTYIVPGLIFHHHRKVGERDGARHRRWYAQGAGSYFMGYRFSYLALRTLHRARQDPAALAMIAGYTASALRREPRYDDVAVRAYLRRQQSLRTLPARVGEALGRRPVS